MSRTSTPALNRHVQADRPGMQPALLLFVVNFVVAMSGAIQAGWRGAANGERAWPFPPFEQSGICSFEDDWDDDSRPPEEEIVSTSIEHWSPEAIAELPGATDLPAADLQRLLVFLDFGLHKLYYNSAARNYSSEARSTNYFDLLHSIVVCTALQPFSVWRLCDKLGVWPDKFHRVVTESLTHPSVAREERVVQCQTYTFLGEMVHEHVPGAEYLQDDYHNQACFHGGFTKWDIFAFSLTDHVGRVWPFLAESSDDGECLCITIVRCANTGLVLSAIKHLDGSTWSAGMQGFVAHPTIAHEFALGQDDIALPNDESETLEAMHKRWETASTSAFEAGGEEMVKRLRVLQNKWKVAYAFTKIGDGSRC